MDEDSFRDQLAENPGDLDLWLVFADWLEERGDPRGPYLHGNIRLEQGCTRDERVAVRACLREIEEDHGDVSGVWESNVVLTWRYGFASWVSGSARWLLENRAKLEIQPHVLTVSIAGLGVASRTLAAMPMIHRARTLEISTTNSKLAKPRERERLLEFFEELAEVPRVHLQRIEFAWSHVGPEVFACLARLAGRIVELRFIGCIFRLADLAALVGGPSTMQLRSISIHGGWGPPRRPLGYASELRPLNGLAELRRFDIRAPVNFETFEAKEALPDVEHVRISRR